MRILLCHNFYREAGGEDQVFADEGWLLESHGHEVVRYSRHNDDLQDMGRWQAVRTTLWNRQTLEETRRLVGRERPDVLHCHNTFPLISPSIYAAANEAGVPVVQTLHNYRLLCPSALFLRDGHPCEDCMGKFLAWPAIVHRCYRHDRAATTVVAAMLAVHRVRGTWIRRVQRFIALSEFSRQKFAEGGLPAERLAVKVNFMRHDPGVGRGRGGYAIFVGRLAAEKGIETLLAAWQRLRRPLRLKIVGDGPLADRVRAAAACDPHIEYLGRRSSPEVLDLIGEAQCLVLPSICYENCPKSLIEAYAKGTPVIASRLGALQEMVDDGRSGLLFRAGDAADLASGIEAFSMDGDTVAARIAGQSSSEGLTNEPTAVADPPDLAATWTEQGEMRRAARAEFEQKYSADQNHAQLMEIYRIALACRSADADSPNLPSNFDCRPPGADAHGTLSCETEPRVAVVNGMETHG